MTAKSRYRPIWDTLKTKKVVRIAVPREFHARIKKAIIQEKYDDAEWRERQEFLGTNPRLSFEFTETQIIVRLTYTGLGAL